MEIVIFTAGIVLGFIFAWFLAKNQHGNAEFLKKELDIEQKKVIDLNTKIAQLEAKNETYLELAQKEEDLQKKLTITFENIANKVLKENSSEFNKTSQEEISNILKPFKEKIQEFQQKVEATRKEEINDIATLKNEIKQLSQNNQQLSMDANNLAKALKGDNKAQGNWGEVILQRILELSGLREDFEYTTQESFSTEGNFRLQPDVVVHLPENRHVIIDSKVSLVSYENFYNSIEENEKQSHLKDFENSIKNHVKNLSEKTYQNLDGINTPDFVLMFVPLESTFQLIFKENNDLMDFAWNKKIILVGPSTLLAALKTIYMFWNQEKQNRNVLEIVKESGSLYDKFAGFLEDLRNISIQMDRTKDGFENAFNKLYTGKGNILRRIENLKKLGAKTTKQIPQEYLEENLEIPIEIG
ncbi:MAG: DNA recombination protein RmuC [Candidatus Gastranaerophilales bacterium]|nr:DNA recombination protein RmuC [Candidatus Gastranaerophilales bacterium]